MTMLTIYKCDFCGTKFQSRDECKRCEESHIKPLEYLPEYYDHGCYPSGITLKFPDGETRFYE